MDTPLSSTPLPSYDSPNYIWSYQISELEGRLLTLVESLGLPQRQEDAVKSHVRQIVWTFWDDSYVIPLPVVQEMFKRDDIVQRRVANTPVGAGSTPEKPKRKRK